MRPRGLFVGLTTFDVIHYVDAFPEADEKIQAVARWFGAGGPAANAAATFSALGGDATLLTALGSSTLASAAEEELTGSSKVRVVNLARTGDLATSSIVVDRTGRRTVTSMNAAGFDDTGMAEDIDEVPDADVVCFDSHYPHVVEAVVDSRKDHSNTIFDPGGAKPQTDRLMALASHVIASRALAPNETPSAILRRIQHDRIVLAAVSAGSKPLLVKTAEDEHEIAVKHVRAVDTLGAGDVLHGAYAFFLARGKQPRAALEAAVTTAGRSCEHHGPRLTGDDE